MKFHWGHGIALFYTTFAVVLISAVIRSTAFDNSLVTKDYYAEDIAYQSTLNNKANSRRLALPLALDQSGDTIQLNWPIKETGPQLSGEIKLYSPISSTRDHSWPLSINDQGIQRIIVKDSPSGYYRLIVNWTDGKRKYLDEFNIQLNQRG